MDRAGALLLRAVLFCDGPIASAARSAGSAAIQAMVELHAGQVVDTNGAGVVAGFETAGAAIDAGLGLTAILPELAVGIAFGEVLVADADWFGTSVIEAARLQQLAVPGQVLVTSLAVEVAGAADQSNFADPSNFADQGRHSLKGLTERVDVVEALASVPWAAPLQVALAIDMVESTQLLARQGDEESVRLRRLFEDFVVKACRDHGGRLLDQRGDGVVLDLPSVSSAAAAAGDVVRAVQRASLRADTDSAFGVRAAIACQPGDRAGLVATDLVDHAKPGQVVADTGAHRFSRDRGIEFDTTPTDLSIVATDSLVLPTPRALRVDGVFVGRSGALHELLRAWDQACGGQLTMVDITGEPGMGKTRLVSEFAQAAVAQGAAVLFGGCNSELDIPYGSIVDALDQAAALDPEFASIIGAAVDQSTKLSVDIDIDVDIVTDIDTVEPDREVVFERFANQFSQLAACRPIVLVLDDLHWANASTLLVLRQIIMSAPTIRLLVVGTYRPLEIGRGHPLLDLQAELLRLGASPAVLELTPLAPHEVTDLVEKQLKGRADATATKLVERVHRETDGNPFFSQELLRSLIQAGALTAVDGTVTATGDVDALPIPDTVRGVVGGRLNQLDDDVYRLLSLGAVAGAQFSLDVVSQALGRPFDVIIDLVEAAEQVALVTEGDEPRTYAFAHAIVRSTLLDGLSATRLAAAHESLADALEQLPGDWTDALAHHWTCAAGPRAEARALKWLGTAAERDVAALVWEAAISRYRLMLDRLEADSSAPVEQVAQTWLGLGAAMRAIGDAGYLDAVIEAGRCARKIGRADLLAKAAIGSMKPGAWFANANETNDAIIGFCEDALDGLTDEDPARVQVLSIMATSLAFESDRGRRVDLVGEAVRLAKGLGDPTTLASALIAEHLALWDPTTLERRVEIAEELGRIARRRDLPEVEFLAGFFRASALLETGQVHEVRTQLEQLAPLIDRTRNFWFYFLVERMRIGLDIAQDVPDSAAAVDALFEESVSSQADAGGTWAAQHGGLAIHAGRLGDMADSLRTAAEGRRGQGIWSNALVIALLERGDRHEAIELAAELKKPNLDFMWLVSMQMRAEVGYGLGDKEICLDAIEELLPFRDWLGVIASGTLTYGLVSTSIGEAALGAGDYDLAIDVLDQAVRDSNRIDSPFFHAKNSRLLAEAVDRRAHS